VPDQLARAGHCATLRRLFAVLPVNALRKERPEAAALGSHGQSCVLQVARAFCGCLCLNLKSPPTSRLVYSGSDRANSYSDVLNFAPESRRIPSLIPHGCLFVRSAASWRACLGAKLLRRTRARELPMPFAETLPKVFIPHVVSVLGAPVCIDAIPAIALKDVTAERALARLVPLQLARPTLFLLTPQTNRHHYSHPSRSALVA
jgi:hypothetical protein